MKWLARSSYEAAKAAQGAYDPIASTLLRIPVCSRASLAGLGDDIQIF